MKGLPVTVTIKTFDNSDMLNTRFEGDVIQSIGSCKLNGKLTKKKELGLALERNPNKKTLSIKHRE